MRNKEPFWLYFYVFDITLANRKVYLLLIVLIKITTMKRNIFPYFFLYSSEFILFHNYGINVHNSTTHMQLRCQGSGSSGQQFSSF